MNQLLMRRSSIILLLLLLHSAIFSQGNREIKVLQKLDSIKNSDCISRHFADIYLATTKQAIGFFKDSPDATKNFIERLETSFSGYFFRSVDSFAQKKMIPEEWKDYFKDSSLSPLQYKLLGINAHINGDIWQALT